MTTLCAHCHNPIDPFEDAYEVGYGVYCERCINDIYEDMKHSWDGPVADVVHKYLTRHAWIPQEEE